MKKHTPVLKNMMLMQIGALLVGFVLIGIIFFSLAQLNIKALNEKNVREVQQTVKQEEERLRAWKFMGMDIAIADAINPMIEDLNLKFLKVVERKSLPQSLKDTQFFLPENSENLFEEDFVVFGEIKPQMSIQTLFFNQSLIFVLLSFAVLFILILLFTSKYIKKNIYSPILKLYNQLQDLAQDSSAYLSSIPAKGEIGEFLDNITKVYNESKIKEKNAVKFRIARQVAHDIRSPLVALDVATQDLSALPEDNRILITDAIKRIKDIANNLLNENKPNTEAPDFHLISLELDKIVSEKRLQLKGNSKISLDYKIEEDSSDAFSFIESNRLQRCISNVINNSIEAIEDTGSINITLFKSKDLKWNCIKIKDTGIGIPQSKLEQVFDSGFSYGKTGGHGLGLSYLKESVKKLNGSLEIQSKLNEGTEITVRLPAEKAPDWFAKKIQIDPNANIVIVDDYKSIHDIWAKKFEALNDNFFAGRILRFEKLSEFVGWLQSVSNKEDFLFLIDYHFVHERRNGIDVIEEFALQDNAYLVTSQFERPLIRNRLKQSGIKTIPKQLVKYIPFHFKGEENFSEINQAFYNSSNSEWLIDLSVLKGIQNGEDLDNLRSFLDANLVTGKERVLEIGFGGGRVLKWVKDNYPNPIDGIDIAKTNYLRCKELFKDQDQVKLLLGNVCSEESFKSNDYHLAIWAWSGIYELSYNEKKLAAMNLVDTIAPNGHIIIDLPNELKGGEKLSFSANNIVEQISAFGVVKNQVMKKEDVISLFNRYGFYHVDTLDYFTSKNIHRSQIILKNMKEQNATNQQKINHTISHC